MKQEEIFAERFRIEQLAGRGGMGRVYRALDQKSGERVALKILEAHSVRDIYRFQREARVLSELSHPGIVSYVLHGQTHEGESFLAMEWLEGEVLSARLARSKIPLEESVTLLTLVAEALAAAHRRGVIHRDIKPSNLFLVGGKAEAAKILDFGIARMDHSTQALTQSGVILGSPGYIAPEQAKGQREILPSADIFSLGCVLFHCLTGRPAFFGENLMAVLAKLLLEEVPRVGEVLPGIPRALEALLCRMLSKDPRARPPDGTELLRELGALGDLSGGEARADEEIPASLTSDEQKFLCVVLASREAKLLSEPSHTTAQTTTQRLSLLREEPESTTLPTLTMAESDAAREALALAVEPHGGQLEMLADGSLVVTVFGAGVATDHAAQAARCALALRQALPSSPIALATGRGTLSGRLPVGEVIDRAARMLRAGNGEWGMGNGDGASPPYPISHTPYPIRLDEVTVGLLGSRFEILGDEHGLRLQKEREWHLSARTLLGRPSPLVGRGRELDNLRSIFSECTRERVARAVLLTAPPGFGKSRLRDELLQGLADPKEILFGYGDPMRAGSPFGLLCQALRGACGILEGEPKAAQQQKLRARVGRHHRGEEVPGHLMPLARVVEFLGELIGVAFPDEESVQLRAARKDALLMGDQMRRAFARWLSLECGAGGLLLVLEDLHWGDLPSIKCIDAALRVLGDFPLMVLACARPEVHDLFPRLWSERGLIEMRLPPLSRGACERLAREVLGEDTSKETMALLCERAGGNAFYLEELLRAVAGGQGQRLPETVLAMVQGRIEGLSASGRLVLRAASVFGTRFWRGGVRALLGGTREAQELPRWLEELYEQEIIAPEGEGKFPQEPEYSFRHSFFRDASYAMLTPGDRSLGHRLAAEWLAERGESAAIVLAEHFERGGEPSLAVRWYLRAAEQALEGNDMEAVLARARRGLACGAEGEARGLFCALAGEAHLWRGENAEADRMGIEALSKLSPGSAMWCKAAGGTFMANAQLGNHDRLLYLVDALCRLTPAPEAKSAYVMASGILVLFLNIVGIYGLSEKLLAQIEKVGGERAEREPGIQAWICLAHCYQAELIQGRAWTHLTLAQEAQLGFLQAGDMRSRSVALLEAAKASKELGAYQEGERFLREALSLSEGMGLLRVAAGARSYLAQNLATQGALEESLLQVKGALALFAQQKNRPREGMSRSYLAQVLLARGEHEQAEREAHAAIRTLAAILPGKAEALATLAQILLAKECFGEALAAAREARGIIKELGTLGYGEARISLLFAEALLATGQPNEAKEALLEAKERLVERAAEIEEEAYRESFWKRVPENARIVALLEKPSGKL